MLPLVLFLEGTLLKWPLLRGMGVGMGMGAGTGMGMGMGGVVVVWGGGGGGAKWYSFMCPWVCGCVARGYWVLLHISSCLGVFCPLCLLLNWLTLLPNPPL